MAAATTATPDAEANGHAELLPARRDENGSGGDAVPVAHRAAAHGGGARGISGIAAWVHEDPLLALTLLGVAVGIGFGLLLSAVLPGAGDATGFRDSVVKLVSLPGRMFLNLLKMMVLPLISGSMIAGVCALKSAGANTGKLARVTFSYFAATTLIAVVIGLVVVNVVQPGEEKNAQACNEVRGVCDDVPTPGQDERRVWTRRRARGAMLACSTRCWGSCSRCALRTSSRPPPP